MKTANCNKPQGKEITAILMQNCLNNMFFATSSAFWRLDDKTLHLCGQNPQNLPKGASVINRHFQTELAKH